MNDTCIHTNRISFSIHIGHSGLAGCKINLLPESTGRCSVATASSATLTTYQRQHNSRHRFLCLLQTRILRPGVDHLPSEFFKELVLLIPIFSFSLHSDRVQCPKIFKSLILLNYKIVMLKKALS